MAALEAQPAVQPVPYRQPAQVLVALDQPQVGLRDAVAERARVGVGPQAVQVAPELVRVSQLRRVEPTVPALGPVLADGLDEGGVHPRVRLGQCRLAPRWIGPRWIGPRWIGPRWIGPCWLRLCRHVEIVPVRRRPHATAPSPAGSLGRQ